MDPREELELLRAKKARLAELQSRAGATPPADAPAKPESSNAKDLFQGLKASVDRTALGIKGLLPNAVQAWGDRIDQATGSGGLTEETATQAPDSTAGTIGSVGGDIAQALIPGNAALKAANVVKKGLALTRAAGAARAAALGTDVALNAGASAAMTSKDRDTAALWGAGGTAAGAAAGRVLGGVARESVSPQAQTLMDAGVHITPGQAVSGPQASTIPRMLRGVEDKISSIPLLGDVITNAQHGSLRSFNVNRINDAISSVGGKVKAGGIEGLDAAHGLISDSYNAALPHISVNQVRAGGQINQALQNSVAQPLFDVAHQNKLEQYIDRRIYPLLSNGNPIDGKTFKQLDAELGELSRKYKSSGIGNEPLGQAFSMLRDAWRQSAEGATPEAKVVLANANKAYAKLLPLEEAGNHSVSGFFSPKHVADALRKLHMEPDPVVQAARQVLPNTVPDSGTAGRQILSHMLHPTGLGAGAAAGATMLSGFGPAAASALGAAALYTKPGLAGATQGIHPLVKALRGSPAAYDPNNIEDIIRNLAGRSATAYAQGEQ